jgi:hypothetical protein
MITSLSSTVVWCHRFETEHAAAREVKEEMKAVLAESDNNDGQDDNDEDTYDRTDGVLTVSTSQSHLL